MGESERPRIMNRLRAQDFTDLKSISDDVLIIIKSLLNHSPEKRMELEVILNSLPWKDQQSVEKIKVSLNHLYLSKDYTVYRVIFAPM